MNANHLRPSPPLRIAAPRAVKRPRITARGTRKPSGFTLIEILVALGIFSILLTIIMVPLNMGVNMTRIGSARTDTQQAAQTLMNRIVTELRGASYVFPNEPMPGITDKAPYTNNPIGSALGFPYFRSVLGTDDVCSDKRPEPFANTSRLDFLANDPRVQTEPHSVVSFYTARADVKRKWNDTGVDGNPYTADLNPIVMYRAQMPFDRYDKATGSRTGSFLIGGKPNVIIGSARLPLLTECTTSGADINQGARWLMHNGAGEPLLAIQSDPALNPAAQEEFNPAAGTAPTDPASNSRISPLGVGFYAPQATNDVVATSLADNSKTGRMFTPSTTFICEDTNANGIIDRVTITLVMGKYDGAGAENRAQSVRLVQTVDLPNVESRFGGAR